MLVALTDADEDLLSQNSWNKDIQYMNFSQDGLFGMTDLNLSLPEKPAKSLKEISGYLELSTGSEKTEDVDLEFGELVNDAKGKKFGAVIQNINTSQPNTRYTYSQFTIRAKLPLNKVKKVKVLDENGKAVEFQTNVNTYGQDEIGINCHRQGSMPKKGKVIVELYSEVLVEKVPFKFLNAPLFDMTVKEIITKPPVPVKQPKAEELYLPPPDGESLETVE